MKYIALVISFLSVLLGSTSTSGQSRYGVDVNTASAIIEGAERVTQLRVPMRDGIKLNADILFPKKPKNNLPAILIRTPYAFKSEISSLRGVLAKLLQEGYVVILNHERGRFYSEGTYSFLAGAFEDGYDTVDWISKQPWSNGKVGTIGCSSSAENQLGLAVADHPAHAAMIPMAPGAAIGNIGPYNEQGNFYRGGAWQGLWLAWYYGSGTRYKPSFPDNISHSERELLGRYFDIKPKLPKIDLMKAIEHLPIKDITNTIDALPSDLDDFITRFPNDPRWNKQDFVREGQQFGVPTLWVFSWYDIATPINIAFANHQRQVAKTATVRENQFMVVSPGTHCSHGKETTETIVGERNVGDASFDYLNLYVDWFDHWLKGIENGVTQRPKNMVYSMGRNEWQASDLWPQKDTQKLKLYLNSVQGANSRMGDGILASQPPTTKGSDAFSYDPVTPVPSNGGSICCFNGMKGGAFDQSALEMRGDILVYTSAPFEKGIDVSGYIDVTLFLSSNVPDTDLTVKLLVVDKNGKAYNLDDSIQRVRYRDSYQHPSFMEADKVYQVSIGPLATSNYFAAGERIRIEVSSSNFPRYGRNLNTGGNNFDESLPRVARNKIHHSNEYASHISLDIKPAQ